MATRLKTVAIYFYLMYNVLVFCVFLFIVQVCTSAEYKL